MSDHEEQRPKPYHHGDLRNALIQAGLEILAEGGAATLDLRQVARKVGVSHAAPYRHFTDKQALVAAITEEGFRRLAALMQATLPDGPDDAVEQLQRLARVYVQFAQEHPWLFREMFSGLTIEREAFTDLQAAYKTVFKLYAAVVQRGQEQGQMVEGNPRALAGVLWALLHGVAMLTIEHQIRPYAEGSEGTERITRFSVQMLYEGLARKNERSPEHPAPEPRIAPG